MLGLWEARPGLANPGVTAPWPELRPVCLVGEADVDISKL